jgi:tricorn protease
LKRLSVCVAAWLGLCLATSAQSPEKIRLANSPDLSPDGKTLVFEWMGDIWSVPTTGGPAKQLTKNAARDVSPKFSPDGKQIAFVSNREGSNQVYLMPVEGGAPQQRTFHTAGYKLEGWTPDNKQFLISGSRDHHWRHAARFFLVNAQTRQAEQMLFDDYGADGVLSPDGKRLLFTREGEAWWRKGYKGSQASQIWLYDLESKSFQKVLAHDAGCRWPLWKPDGNGFYYVGAQSGSMNLREYDLQKKTDRQVTTFTKDSVVFPCISRDGSKVVFRHLFDFYWVDPNNGGQVHKIDITYNGDNLRERTERRSLTQATAAGFSDNGLEIAFISGGDLWVMDTELREPKQVTTTADEEHYPVFSPKGDAIWFISDKDGQSDIWKAEKTDPKLYWWQQTSFKLTRLTNDEEVKSELRFSPEGSQVAFIKGRGDLWVMDLDGKNAKPFLKSWNRPEFDWSPDGKWIVYSQEDEDFNRDIWIKPLDNSRPAYNLTRSPYNESNPVWSPDGKVIAFTGRRGGTEVDVFYVWLPEDEDQKSDRDRTLEKALEKMKRGPVSAPMGGPQPAATSPGQQGQPGPGFPRRRRPGTDSIDDETEKQEKKEEAKPAERKPTLPKVVIDFDRLHERIRRISIPDSTESGLFWSPDGKRLAFNATVGGNRGIYTVEIPGRLTPQSMTTATISQPRWLAKGNQIVCLSGGLPASLSAAGTVSTFAVRCPQEVNLSARNIAAFDLAWRTMRDNYYDERLGNNDWNAIRAKYRPMAGEVPDVESLTTVIQLMLGELNGSHLGFTPTNRRAQGRGTPLPFPLPTPGPTEPEAASGWRVETAHLGVRFDDGHPGPGLKIREVIPNTPADRKKTKLAEGEVILTIDGKKVEPGMDLTLVLNGQPSRDMVLHVKGTDGKERDVILRPATFGEVRQQLYDKWIKDNRKLVDKLSGGTLGYVHINAMSMPSFYKFEEELFAAGHGKEGLVIDVRENGGGSTADHLLTALSQPVHAHTIPRGGSVPGYPLDRKVYATWNKPIIVLCNQNSFSNAEIFSHAIKTLKRGKLVGVPTAGGVISTGGTTIMDVGFLRLPFRGWYLLETGEDMELNGAVPDVIVWPEPGDLAQGRDRQVEKAVETLLADVKEWKARPQPKLRKASERPEFSAPAKQ